MKAFSVLLFLSLSAISSAARVRSIPDELQRVLQYFKPDIQQKIKEKVPASIGNCNNTQHAPPQPCQEMGDLMVMDGGMYRATARWLGGLQHMELKVMNFGYLEPNVVGIYIQVSLPQLPMSLRVDLCTFGCRSLFDDTSSCCGTNKKLMALVSFKCSTSDPYLSEMHIEYINIFPSIKVRKLFEVTAASEKMIKEQFVGLVPSDLLDQVNHYIPMILGKYEYTCDSLL